MKIADVRLYRFRLPLKRPLKTPVAERRFRDGILIELRGDSGAVSCGEVSPLPGFSRESLGQAEKELLILRSFLLTTDLPSGLQRLDGGFKNWLGQLSLSASVRFGIESAVVSLLASAKGQTLPDLFGGTQVSSVKINALLSGSAKELMAQADTAVGEGYSTLKVKVGRLVVADAAGIIQQVRDRVGSKVALRVDANRAFALGDALALLRQIEGCQVEYVEEPAGNLNQLRKLLSEKGRKVPVALDESLLEIEPDDLSKSYRIKAVVIKPSLLGLERAMLFVRAAASHGMAPVISSSFESSVGIGVLAALAATVGDNVHGLDTVNWLAKDLPDKPIQVAGGSIDSRFYDRRDLKIQSELLEEIAVE